MLCTRLPPLWFMCTQRTSTRAASQACPRVPLFLQAAPAPVQRGRGKAASEEAGSGHSHAPSRGRPSPHQGPRSLGRSPGGAHPGPHPTACVCVWVWVCAEGWVAWEGSIGPVEWAGCGISGCVWERLAAGERDAPSSKQAMRPCACSGASTCLRPRLLPHPGFARPGAWKSTHTTPRPHLLPSAPPPASQPSTYACACGTPKAWQHLLRSQDQRPTHARARLSYSSSASRCRLRMISSILVGCGSGVPGTQSAVKGRERTVGHKNDCVNEAIAQSTD